MNIKDIVLPNPLVMEGFDIDTAKTFAEVHVVRRQTTSPGFNNNKPTTEELIPAATVMFILQQLEHNYVPEKFI